jgi:hypothetical protein
MEPLRPEIDFILSRFVRFWLKKLAKRANIRRKKIWDNSIRMS